MIQVQTAQHAIEMAAEREKLVELREVHEAQMEVQKNAEAKLLLKIDELDGGAARAEREKELIAIGMMMRPPEGQARRWR